MITNSVMDPENPRRLDFYYDEQGALLGFRYNGQDYWYIRNGQNDIAGIIDSTGTQVVSYTYDSWGVPISTTGSMAGTIGEINPFRYRGYYYDSETGLYYLNSRYYDPVIGRFINADGLVVAGSGMLSSNMYLYCQNNPVCCVDPTGALGSFFDFPLSMADRMQMSQSMLDSYNAAKAAASTTSPSQSSSNNFLQNIFGAGSTLESKTKIGETVYIPDPLPITSKTTVKSGKIVAKSGDSSKPISVYAIGSVENPLTSSAGLKINISSFTLKISLGLTNLGISGSVRNGDVTKSYGIKADIVGLKVGFEESSIVWDGNNSVTTTTDFYISGLWMYMIYELVTTGNSSSYQYATS